MTRQPCYECTISSCRFSCCAGSEDEYPCGMNDFHCHVWDGSICVVSKVIVESGGVWVMCPTECIWNPAKWQGDSILHTSMWRVDFPGFALCVIEVQALHSVLLKWRRAGSFTSRLPLTDFSEQASSHYYNHDETKGYDLLHVQDSDRYAEFHCHQLER